MRTWILTLASILVGIIIALLAANAASANNWPHAKLDNAAWQAVGRPTPVWCEQSWADWIHFGDQFGQDWTWVNGFTAPSQSPYIFINPRQCETLHAIFDIGVREVGIYHAASAILTVIHESMHMRGISDEGVADCTALSEFKTHAVRSFGYPETEQQLVTSRVPVRRTVRVRVGRRYVTRTVTVITNLVSYRTVPSTLTESLYRMAYAWHKAKPPEYQGTC